MKRLTTWLLIFAAMVPGPIAPLAGQADLDALLLELKGESEEVRRAPQEQETAFAAALDWFVDQLDQEDPSVLLTALRDFDRICLRTGRPGAEDQRVALCRALLRRLDAETPKPARVLFLKTLRFIGRGESVDALARLLGDFDPEIREHARQALQNNPAPEADAKFRAALKDAKDPAWCVAIINAIGYRGDAASTAILAPLLTDTDQAVARASASALGKIGGAKTAQVLEAARETVQPNVRDAVSDALLLCADRLLATGNRNAAETIYRRIAEDPNESNPVRNAARRRLAPRAGQDPVSLPRN